MEFLIPEVYTGAFGIICKALAQAGQQQITAKKDTFWVDFEILVNLPKPNEIITRCFVCLYEYIYIYQASKKATQPDIVIISLNFYSSYR
jgi:hypothetical protein